MDFSVGKLKVVFFGASLPPPGSGAGDPGKIPWDGLAIRSDGKRETDDLHPRK